jgi:hypothetical protein
MYKINTHSSLLNDNIEQQNALRVSHRNAYCAIFFLSKLWIAAFQKQLAVISQK